MSLITYKAHELQLHKEVGSAVASKALTESLRGEVTQVLNTFPTEDRSQIRSFLLCEDDGEFLCLFITEAKLRNLCFLDELSLRLGEKGWR